MTRRSPTHTSFQAAALVFEPGDDDTECCPICREWPLPPAAQGTCGHTFCQACIDPWRPRPCPLCRADWQPEANTPAPSTTPGRLPCGCTIPARDARVHYAGCPQAPGTCGHCTWTGTRAGYARHAARYHRRCPHPTCLVTGSADQIQRHRATCPQVLVPCIHPQCATQLPRLQLAGHIRTCRYFHLDCPYLTCSFVAPTPAHLSQHLVHCPDRQQLPDFHHPLFGQVVHKLRQWAPHADPDGLLAQLVATLRHRLQIPFPVWQFPYVPSDLFTQACHQLAGPGLNYERLDLAELFDPGVLDAIASRLRLPLMRLDSGERSGVLRALNRLAATVL